MKRTLIVSLLVHVAISLIALNWVSFHQVRYVPRQVYNVTLVTAEAQAQPAPPVVSPPEPTPVPEPETIKPEPVPEEEMPPPPDKPKSKPKKKEPEKKKEVPTTDIARTQTPPSARSDSASAATAQQTGDMSFDAPDFQFAPYINRMRHKIAASWRVPEGSQEDRQCRIYFRVHRDGSVSHVTVEESSDLFMFDQAAQRAVLQAAPMPPLPREYLDEYLGVHFSFAFRAQQ